MKKAYKGFPLAEILIIVAVIVLISSLIVNILSASRMKSRDAKRKQDIDQIKIGLQIYANLRGHLPQTKSYGEANTDGIDSSAQGDFVSFLATSTIFSKVPHDPLNNNTGSPVTTDDGYSYGYYCYPPTHGGNPFPGSDTVSLWYPSETNKTVTRIDYRAPAPCL